MTTILEQELRDQQIVNVEKEKDKVKKEKDNMKTETNVDNTIIITESNLTQDNESDNESDKKEEEIVP
jgi:hypothetical protein